MQVWGGGGGETVETAGPHLGPPPITGFSSTPVMASSPTITGGRSTWCACRARPGSAWPTSTWEWTCSPGGTSWAADSTPTRWVVALEAGVGGSGLPEAPLAVGRSPSLPSRGRQAQLSFPKWETEAPGHIGDLPRGQAGPQSPSCRPPLGSDGTSPGGARALCRVLLLDGSLSWHHSRRVTRG